MVNKLIVNKSAIESKYGTLAPLFWAQMDKLIASDRKHGTITELVCIDDAAQMLKINAPAVTTQSDCAQNKKAIDGVFHGFNPHFMVLIGADDIIPFQKLKNPTIDSDKDVPSDLPYACNAPYSTKISDFFAPTRLVSRLPDVKGKVTDQMMALFIQMIDAIISHYPEEPEDFRNIWHVRMATRNATAKLIKAELSSCNLTFHEFESPPDGPDYGHDAYLHMVHFHMLHGDEKVNTLYGEDSASGNMPEAILGTAVQDNLQAGMLAQIKSCYAAQLYEPNQAGFPLANIYLSSGAAAFFGPINIGYGNKNRMIAPDLLHCDFLENISDGDTAAQALLNARQSHVQRSRYYMDSIEQKTYAQYMLYGYGSINLLKGAAMDENSLEEMLRDTQRAAEEAASAVGYMALASDAVPSETARAYIAAYLAQKGANEAPQISVYALTGGAAFQSQMQEDDKQLRQYSVTLGTGASTRIYLFTEENGAITKVDEYEAD